MTHLEALAVLPKYFEGGVDRETTRAFHEHIKTCTDCRDQIKLMRQFKQRELKKDEPALPAAGHRPRHLAPPPFGRRARFSSFNSNDLRSREAQRGLVMKLLLAAGLFFVAVRYGLFEMLYK